MEKNKKVRLIGFACEGSLVVRTLICDMRHKEIDLSIFHFANGSLFEWEITPTGSEREGREALLLFLTIEAI